MTRTTSSPTETRWARSAPSGDPLPSRHTMRGLAPGLRPQPRVERPHREQTASKGGDRPSSSSRPSRPSRSTRPAPSGGVDTSAQPRSEAVGSPAQTYPSAGQPAEASPTRRRPTHHTGPLVLSLAAHPIEATPQGRRHATRAAWPGGCAEGARACASIDRGGRWMRGDTEREDARLRRCDGQRPRRAGASSAAGHRRDRWWTKGASALKARRLGPPRTWRPPD